MTIGTIISSATSGMSVAQLGLGTVSTNIANVNTPGYVREVVNPTSVVTAGVGAGVSTAGVALAANQYLQNASLGAAGQASSASVVSGLLNQAQTLFGDPTSSTGYFNQLGTMFSDFSTLANDPSSVLSSTQAVSDVNQFLSQSQSIATSLNGLNSQADQQITSDVGQVNQLLSQISGLNADITQTTAQGGDATASQNTQNELLNQLSSLIDVNATPGPNGTINVRTTSGVLLAGAGGAATLAYNPVATTSGQITVTPPGSTSTSDLTVASGEISGLLSLRGTQIPAVSAQLSEFVTQTVNALNAAHNASSSVPAAHQLTGTNTGLDLPTAISGFTGKTTVAIVNPSGQLQQSVAIDFGAGTMSANGGAAVSFTPSTFLATLNAELGVTGTASFSNGALSLQASNVGDGVAIADDPTTPSSKVGEGFSQYFGLNDLVTSTGITNYNTGLQPTDPSGLTGAITLRVANANGARIQDVTVTAPPGGTMQNLLDALNDPSTGVGLYGKFSLNSQGALTFAPTTPGSASIAVLKDTTQEGAGGPSMSQLFGIGVAQQASRTSTFAVRADIQANPANLATAQLNLSATLGQTALSPGDASGALALAQAGDAQMNFAAAGAAPASTTSVNNYAAQLSGQIGLAASNADQASTNASAVQTEANTRLQSVEGVSLDQELVNLTTYQQAYTASARLLQAATDIFTALIGVVP
jgi:flagellar hook-associated protein 1 FlgK